MSQVKFTSLILFLWASIVSAYNRTFNIALYVSDPSPLFSLGDCTRFSSFQLDNQQAGAMRGFGLHAYKVKQMGGIPIGKSETDYAFFNLNCFNIFTNITQYGAKTVSALTQINSGTYGNYEIHVPSRLSPTIAPIASYCENTKNCIVLAPQTTSPAEFVCQSTLSAVCISKNRKTNQRIYDYTFRTSQSSANILTSFFDRCRVEKIKSMAMIQYSNPANPYSNFARPQAIAAGMTFAPAISFTVPVLPAVSLDPAIISGYTDALIATNAEVLVIFALPLTAYANVAIQIIKSLKEKNYNFKSIMVAGGAAGLIVLPTFGIDSDGFLDPDLEFIVGSIPWFSGALGPDFTTTSLIGNIEPWATNSLLSAPMQFQQDLYAFEPAATLSHVKTLYPIDGGASVPAITTMSQMLLQKAIEGTGNINCTIDDIRNILAIVSSSSIGGKVQVDATGSLLGTDRFAFQLLKNFSFQAGSTTTKSFYNQYIAPASLANSWTIPAPTWRERYPIIYYSLYGVTTFLSSAILAIACYIALVIVERSFPDRSTEKNPLTSAQSFSWMLVSSYILAIGIWFSSISLYASMERDNLYGDFKIVTFSGEYYFGINQIPVFGIMLSCVIMWSRRDSLNKTHKNKNSVEMTRNLENGSIQKSSGTATKYSATIPDLEAQKPAIKLKPVYFDFKIISSVLLFTISVVSFQVICWYGVYISANKSYSYGYGVGGAILCFLFGYAGLWTFFYLIGFYRWVSVLLLWIGVFGDILLTFYGSVFTRSELIAPVGIDSSIILIISVSIFAPLVIFFVLFSISRSDASRNLVNNDLIAVMSVMKNQEEGIKLLRDELEDTILLAQLIQFARTPNLTNPLMVEFLEKMRVRTANLPNHHKHNSVLSFGSGGDKKSIDDEKTLSLNSPADSNAVVPLQSTKTYSLNEILTHPFLFSQFCNTAVSRKAPENIQFLIEVQFYSKQKKDELRKIHGESIMQTFIVAGSTSELNIQSEMREDIIKTAKAKNYPATLFKEVFMVVLTMLNTNDYPPFYNRVELTNLCKAVLENDKYNYATGGRSKKVEPLLASLKLNGLPESILGLTL